jgi:hypothetical protein
VTSPTTSWVPYHPLGVLLDAQVYVDPEVLGHDTVTFAAGTQTESVKMQTQELFGADGPGGGRSSFIRLLARAE